MQLRLGVDTEAQSPEVWAALGANERAEVIGRLGEAMLKAVAPGATGQGGDSADEDIEDSGGELTAIA